ncbi:MAG TPA: GDP-mannose 4,6-dehydratase, partial [Acidobacteriota bacterium]
KLFGYWIVVNYREAYNLHACNGILFNHESPRRGETFVTRKATRAAARIKLGIQDKLTLGNLDATRDWGYAPEYVDGMWRMLQLEKAEDFVLATGETHSVREFVDVVFKELDMELEWKGKGLEEKGVSKKDGKVLVEVDARYHRPTEVDRLVGDAAKAKQKLGWKATTSFQDLARLMAQADFEKAKKPGR